MTEARVDLGRFREGDRAFGILPFWFLNGELDPDEMRFQLAELRDKGMHGVILHGRYGLEMPYLGDRYLDRIRLAAEEANRLGLATWIYDEMNWPSGTADKRVLQTRPDLAQRYIECLGFTIQGPWFMCLTGEDSRYLDFERSEPVAAFAIGEDGSVVDLTPNLSFEKVMPWEVPPGEWRLMYIVEKRADYYIDALDPEATATFLRVGYRPYLDALGDGDGPPIQGFYSDEPAMHYFVTAGDNPVVPWTKDMIRRFAERNGYDLRPRLPDLFFDVRPDSSRVRHDFYNTLTDLYSDAYYRQIHDWCREHGVVFTAHLLYEEWLRRMIRVEGNLFRHYSNMDVVAVDHLYPVIGTRESPDQHVAIKVASSAAHHFGSPRVICESFGGIFMDATLQRMKWIADWEYVLGVNLLNPHGYHYTLEGPRKRDWPPSMFYQYPWWRYYGGFSSYVSRLSEVLSAGRHVAAAAVLWPINAMFATYIPQDRTPAGDQMESDFNRLTDLLLRLHVGFDYLDEDVFAHAEIADGQVRIGDEAYSVVVIPPITHVRLTTVERLEQLVAAGGRVLGMVFAPEQAFGADGLVDVRHRMANLLGAEGDGKDLVFVDHPAGGRGGFINATSVEEAHSVLAEALAEMAEPDITIDNDELFTLHRQSDGKDLHYVVNPTFEEQPARVTLPGRVTPRLWDPTTGADRAADAVAVDGERTAFDLVLPPVGSVLVVVDGSDGMGATSANAQMEQVGEPLVLDGEWEFRSEGPNALVLSEWLSRPEKAGPDIADIAGNAARDDDTTGWRRMVPGAWSHQLEAEPDRYPVPVWYRTTFEAEHVPARMQLVVDGWAGSSYRAFVNGNEVLSIAERSPFDSQMKTLDMTDLIRAGTNVVAIRLVVEGPRDGLLDRLKVLGEFALVSGPDGTYRVVAPRTAARPAPWTEQGYPFLSGLGCYRRTVTVPEEFDGCRLLLEIPIRDDVVEVVVGGDSVGVRMWDPYEVEVTGRLRPGENEVELRVANTAANLIGGVDRPSGLAGPPRLAAYRERPAREEDRA